MKPLSVIVISRELCYPFLPGRARAHPLAGIQRHHASRSRDSGTTAVLEKREPVAWPWAGTRIAALVPPASQPATVTRSAKINTTLRFGELMPVGPARESVGDRDGDAAIGRSRHEPVCHESM